MNTALQQVTPEDIEENIASEYFFVVEAGKHGLHINSTEAYVDVPGQAVSQMTICVLLLKNGFTQMGESSCVNAHSFDAEIGKTVARQNAINKLWGLMGYALQEKLHEALA